MRHAFELSDEQHEIVRQAAEAAGRTPEHLVLAWTLDEEARSRRAHPTNYVTEDWLRHLEMTDGEIQETES